MNPPIFKDYSLKIRDLIVVELDAFNDERGSNIEGYNGFSYSICKQFSQRSFCVDSFSYSKRGVLRGFHGDTRNDKLIQCLFGHVQLAVIDMRESVTTYGNVLEFHLNSTYPSQVLVPAGCVNAHLCISAECLFSYKLSYGYIPIEDQIHVKWNDPKYNIRWAIQNPVLSERDS